MSRYTSWARSVAADPAYRLNHPQRCVLMWLASHADATGAAWPSSATLADEMLMHEVTVRKALAVLSELRQPATGHRLFADVVRRHGQSTYFQFPAPEPVAQGYTPVAADYRPTAFDVTVPVAQGYRPVAEPVAEPVAQGYTEVLEVNEVKASRAREDYAPDHVRGYCPDCGHHWIHHRADGCHRLCDCRIPRP